VSVATIHGMDSNHVRDERLFLVSRPSMRPSQLPIQWVLGAPSPGEKRPRREAEESLPLRNGGSTSPLPHTSTRRGIKHKDNNFTLTLHYIPTERPPLVGEVSAHFSGERVSRDQRNESPRPLISVF
jgi:hypothetical protein